MRPPKYRGIDGKHNRPPRKLRADAGAWYASRLNSIRASEKAERERPQPASAEQLAARDAQDKADLAAENAAQRAKTALDRAVASAAKEVLGGKG